MTIALKNRLDLLLGFLYAPGDRESCEPISGITRFEKLVWLLLAEKRKDPSLFDFGFKADNYGPYSEALVDDLEKLQSLGLIRIETAANEVLADELQNDNTKPSRYFLTPQGKKIVEHKLLPGSEDIFGDMKSLKKQFNNKPLGHLIAYVYRNAPQEMLKNSLIKDKYLRWENQ